MHITKTTQKNENVSGKKDQTCQVKDGPELHADYNSQLIRAICNKYNKPQN